MNIVLIGDTLTLIGGILIAYAALRVHHRVLYEHKIDRVVFMTMRREQKIGVIGVLFLVLGFIFSHSFLFGF